MSGFKRYKRKGVAEMRKLDGKEAPALLELNGVSVSQEDRVLFDVDPGKYFKGFVARNPDNHNDKWYVAIDYAIENFEGIDYD